MKRMWTILVLLCVAAGCGGDDDGSGPNPNAILLMGEQCATDFPNDCPERVCEDVVSGTSSMGGVSYGWDAEAVEGTICTRRCDGDEGCSGIDFAGANGHSVESEVWSCSGGLCRVHVTPASTGGSTDICDGCGGALCAGDCIGCPQCR
ncbi:MAG: hypothetical protein OXT09_03405 [Myxococcales bacterium]|nr:hypothetical protein [Myxococcales bacterium]